MKKNKVKKVKHYLYQGLGFAVELPEVEMVFIDNQWHPKVDVKKVADATIKALACQSGRLTGNQVRFIRTYLSMTLREFAEKVVHESHTAVHKWEKCGDNATNMDRNIEAMLKLYLCDKVITKTIKHKHEFYEKYLQIKQIFTSNDPVIPLTL
jgi:DNA-binding transcriptional regulator YiaG